MAFYDQGGMGEQPMGGGGGAMARKPRKGGSAAAVPGQMTNTAMPGTQQLSTVPPGMEQGANFQQMVGGDASGNTAPPVDNPYGSGMKMPGLPQGGLSQQPGSLEGYTPGPMQFGGAPGAKPGKGGGATQFGGGTGGVVPPGLGGMIKNRVQALRGRGGMGGGMGGGY